MRKPIGLLVIAALVILAPACSDYRKIKTFARKHPKKVAAAIVAGIVGGVVAHKKDVFGTKAEKKELKLEDECVLCDSDKKMLEDIEKEASKRSK